VALPFSLQQVSGTHPIGRPAIYDRTALRFKGQPVVMNQLTAVFRVASSDPVAAFRQWVGQIAELELGRINVQAGGVPGQWLVASAYGPYEADRPPIGWAEVALWNTADGPILLVDVAQRPGVTSTAVASVPPSIPHAPMPPVPATDTERPPGKPLFIEQGHTVHVPAGAWKLMATLRTPSGTGGSRSVLATRDASATLAALLKEARSLSSGAEVQGPDTSTYGNLEVTELSFVIPAGGWGFQAVAVRGSGDDDATVYVTSGAD
jgi:hypothetical protein